jgi:hypothetical protein
MNFVKATFILLLIIASVSITSAQEPKCTLTIAQLPQAQELRGFRLGMTIEQIKARIPKLLLGRTDQFGVAKTSINPDFNPDVDKPILQGVRTVSFEFLDGRLFSLWIGYNSSFKWQRLDEFLGEISKVLHLPNAWKTSSWRGQVLDCEDFQVTIKVIGGSPSILLSDEAAKQVIEKRMSLKEEDESRQP